MRKVVITIKKGKVHTDLQGFQDASCREVMDELQKMVLDKLGGEVEHTDKPEAYIMEELKDYDTN